MNRFETTYLIQCFKDGSMIWEEIKEDSPRNKKYEGNWKKVTKSKFDKEYTWFEFRATTYDLNMNAHYDDMIGFVDTQGRLYNYVSYDPIPAMENNESICQLSVQ